MSTPARRLKAVAPADPPLKVVARRKALNVIKRSPASVFAQCRSMGHSWTHVGRVLPDDPDTRAPLGARVNGAVGFRSRCSECGCHRTKWITRSGDYATAPQYEHPDGYKLNTAHGDVVPSMLEWRKTFYVRLMSDG